MLFAFPEQINFPNILTVTLRLRPTTFSLATTKVIILFSSSY